MKAISIKEPYASYIDRGIKTIETRTWGTNYRGELLLCCSQDKTSPLSGKAFAVCTLKYIRKMRPRDEKLACCYLYPKALAWILEDIKPIKPIKVIGKLGLFEVEILEGQIEYRD